MAAYYIGRQIAERIVDLRGFYVLGKAATLNGAVGDVMFADEVFDEHTGNVYSFPNAFGYDEVAPWLERGSALDRPEGGDGARDVPPEPRVPGAVLPRGATPSWRWRPGRT